MSKIVERTLDFFEAFAAEKRPLSLTDLVRILDLPASSCHDVLRALERRGYVHETAPRAGFYPTQKLYDVARVIAENDSIALRAQALMEKACQALGETVTLSKAVGHSAVYLIVIEPEDPVRYSVSAGRDIQSLHSTSIGKSLLSAIDAAEWRDYLGDKPLRRYTPKTITSRTRLRADVDAGRDRGWFVNEEESRPGVITVSAPFSWNRVAHVFTVAGPAARMAAKHDAVVAAVKRSAAQLADPVR